MFLSVLDGRNPAFMNIFLRVLCVSVLKKMSIAYFEFNWSVSNLPARIFFFGHWWAAAAGP